MAPIKPTSRAKNLSAAANLANLLPTGTVLAFQTIMPSLSNNGTCLDAHKYLTLCAIVCCSIACFLSSFTDSFIGNNGKLYYGIATFKGLHVLNKNDDDEDEDEQEDKDKRNNEDEHEDEDKLKDYKISLIDFVHAFASLVVFLVFATSNSDVQTCFFPHPGPNASALMINLPLGVGAFASFLFMIFPSKRRGIGYPAADMAPKPWPPKKKESFTKGVTNAC